MKFPKILALLVCVLPIFYAGGAYSQTACEETFGSDTCFFMPTGQQLAIPARKPSVPPLPPRKPVIITPEIALQLTRPATFDAIYANFLQRARDYYDVDSTGVAFLAETALSAYAIAGGRNSTLSTVVTEGTDLLMGETNPENATEVLIKFLDSALKEVAGGMVETTASRVPLGKQFAEPIGKSVVAVFDTSGTLAAMFVFAVADTFGEGPQAVPPALIEQELLYIRSKCNAGSIVRSVPGMFISPKNNEVHVRLGLANCDWQGGVMPFCSSEGCQRRVFEVSGESYFLRETILEGGERERDLPEAIRVEVEMAQTLEREARRQETRAQGSCNAPAHVCFDRNLVDRLTAACVRIRAEYAAKGETVLPAQCVDRPAYRYVQVDGRWEVNNAPRQPW